MNPLSTKELENIYKILRAIDEKLISNPSEEWELDYYEENLIDKKDIKIILKKIEKLLSKDQLISINKPLLRRKYHTFNNEINERVYRILENSEQVGLFLLNQQTVVIKFQMILIKTVIKNERYRN